MNMNQLPEKAKQKKTKTKKQHKIYFLIIFLIEIPNECQKHNSNKALE